MSITFKRRLKPRDFLNRENSITRVLNHSTRFKYRNLSCQGHVTNCWLTRRTAPIMWHHHQKPTWLSKITKKIAWVEWKHVLEVEWTVRSKILWRSLKLYDPIEVHYSRSLTFTDDPLSRQTVWLILSKYFIKTVERMFVIMITSWLFFALIDSCQ